MSKAIEQSLRKVLGGPRKLELSRIGNIASAAWIRAGACSWQPPYLPASKGVTSLEHPTQARRRKALPAGSAPVYYRRVSVVEEP